MPDNWSAKAIMHIKTTCVHIELGMASLHQTAFIFKLLASKTKALLTRRYSLLALNLLLHVLNGVTRLHLKLDCFAGKHPYKICTLLHKPRTKWSVDLVWML